LRHSTQAPDISGAADRDAILPVQTTAPQQATSDLGTPAPALSPAQNFNAIVQEGQSRTLTSPDVVKAIVFQAATVGGGAAFAFGLGRSLGASVAEMIVRAGYKSAQQVGVGQDTANYKESDHHTTQMLVTTVARAVGAAVGGGVGATVGNVLAPRVAALAGKQFKPIPADVLVPDHVAELLTGGRPYGAEGVRQLREQVAAAHKEYGAIVGDAHVHAGEVAFGTENALRGLGQGKQPMGLLVDVPVSTAVSATAGAATGGYAAIMMAKHRLSVPNANYAGEGNAPMVSVPTFQVGDVAPIPDRFTGPTAADTARNIAAGTGDRILHMGKATLPLSAANLTGTAIAAALPKTPGDIGHRVEQALESGAGVAAAVRPWFESQPTIANNDKARIAAQKERVAARPAASEDVEMGNVDGEGRAADPDQGSPGGE